MSGNIAKNISKNLRGKYSHNLLDYAKQSATEVLKTTSKRAIQKSAEETGGLIGNKIADKIAKGRDIEIYDDIEIHRKIYISP